MIKHIFFRPHSHIRAGTQASKKKENGSALLRFKHILTLFFLFVFFLNTQKCNGTVLEPAVSTNQTILCFTPNKLSYLISERISYPTDFQVDVSLHDIPEWLDYYETESNDYKEITLFVKLNYRKNVDTKSRMLKTCLAHRENGQVGDFDVSGESGPPNDLYEYIDCEWDPASDTSYPEGETNKFAFLENKMPPDSGNRTFTLFQSVSSNSVPDVDYYLLRPRGKNYDIWMHNKSDVENSLKVSIVQSNEVKKTKIVNKSNGFVLALSCTNLNENLESYVKVEHPAEILITNKQYSLYANTYYEVREGKKWEESRVMSCLSNSHRQIIYTFKPVSEEMVFEISSDTEDQYLKTSLNTAFYDKDYQYQIYEEEDFFEGSIKQHSMYPSNDKGFFKRFTFRNLKISNIYYCIVRFTSTLEGNRMQICARMSRIKPVFLVHGIDSSPKCDGDTGTSFGDLIESYNYYDIRPFKSYDFIWDSFDDKGILEKNMGMGNNTFGKFISDNRKTNDFRGTIVAHSMGCLLTYYQCINENAHFRENIDNIVLAAPPFFGSATANEVANLAPVTTTLKKTSKVNLQILSRGSEYNWRRHLEPFDFECTNISVLVGTVKHESIVGGAVSSVDSLWKLANLKTYTSAKALLDTFTDPPVDFLEYLADMGRSVFSISTFGLNPIKTSEIYYKNRSDGVVGTYSADISKQDCYKGVKAEEIEKIHGEVPKFKKSNDIFTKEVKERINNIGE